MDDDDFSENSDEVLYDSEEEAEIDQKEFLKQQQAKKIKAVADAEQIDTSSQKLGYDVKKEVEKTQLFKAAEGVKFVEYDEFGLPKTKEGDELR